MSKTKMATPGVPMMIVTGTPAPATCAGSGGATVAQKGAAARSAGPSGRGASAAAGPKVLTQGRGQRGGVAGGGSSMSIVRRKIGLPRVHRGTGNPVSAGRSTDQMVLAAELGTAAPIGPAVIELLSLAYRANIPAALIGPHGIGKSEVAAAAANVIGIDCISRDLSLMEPTDLVGLPKLEGGATTFVPPEFLPRETGRGGFLLIEEINRAPRYMQACCLELLTSRRLNSYRLPEGWVPLACMNPKSEGYVVHLIDAALMSRFMRIDVCATVDSWGVWAQGHGIHPKIIEYVTSVPDSLDESKGGVNPRSWTYASRTLSAVSQTLLERSPDTIVTAINGLIGPVHTTALLRLFFGTERALEPADVLRDWLAAKSTMKRWQKTGRLDLLASSMRKMLQWLRPDGTAESLRAHVRHLAAVRGFIKHLPGDLREQAKAVLMELGHVHLIPADVTTAKGSR